MRFKLIHIVFLAVFTAISAFADEPKDSLASVYAQMANIKKLNVSTSFSIRPGGGYNIKKDGAIVENGNSETFTKFGVNLSYPLFLKGSNRLTASVRYHHLHQHFNCDDQTSLYGFDKAAHHYFAGGLTGMATTQLWSKPLVLVGMANCDFSQDGYERWSAMATAMLMLKRTRETQFGIGLLGMVNTFSRVPVIAVITYRHQFNPQWTLDLSLPNFRVLYTPKNKGIFSLGGSISADSYYLRPKVEDLPKRVRYSRSNINLCTGYERNLGAGFKLNAEAGVQLIMTDRIYKKSSSNVIANLHEKAKPYLSISLQKGFNIK